MTSANQTPSQTPNQTPNQTPDRTTDRTLAGRIMLRVAVGALVTVALVAAGGYWLTFRAFETRELERLEDYVAEKGRTESRLFRTAEQETAAFGALFLEAYANAPMGLGDDFDRFWRRGAEGAWRTVPSLHEGTWTADGDYFRGVSGFISSVSEAASGPGGPDPELRRRLVLALRLAARLAPATDPELLLHATFPENAIVIVSDEPWGLTARADLDMTGQSVVGATLQAANPERAPVWTNLYYDLTADAWAVTYQLPVDRDGRHLITPSNDVRLSSLMERVLDERLVGTHNMILTADGALVAHPDRLDEVQQEKGQIELTELGDSTLLYRHRLIREAGPIRKGAVTLIDRGERDAYLAVTRFHGPDWWWVTVYPREVVAASAHDAARLIVGLGVVFFLLVMGVVTWFLRREVAGPVGTLTEAATVIGRGDYARVADGALPLPEDRPDEIGLLGRTFRQMARSLRGTRELDDALFLTDAGGRILEVNPAAARLTGRSMDELLERTLFDLASEADRPRLRSTFDELEPGRSGRLTIQHRHGDTLVPVELGIRGFETPGGTRFLATARDITERVRREEERLELERRIMETQRFESLGQLAGGVAHDFNNILASILGNAALVRDELPDPSPAADMVDQIMASADRAADLARQMLAYAGKGRVVARTVALSEVCREAVAMSASSKPDHVELRLELDPDLPPLSGDPAQLHQVVTSLVINAWEAMGHEPGTITVRTYARHYSAEELAAERAGRTDDGAPADEYVTLEVADTGPGFGPETAARLFEPFFTTKFTGRGLGLAALLGIVRSHRGAVLVDAEPGQGARFRVLLPPAD
ncbi:MAG: ATP-binding protein [Longimicrobiales bacterium]